MKPDFSGRYALNRSASTLSGGATAVESALLQIDHADPAFRCRAAFVADGKTMEYSFELVSDGREVATSPGETSSLRWEGEALVTRHKAIAQDSDVTMSWRYELQDGGRRLEARERIRAGGRDETNVWVFGRC